MALLNPPRQLPSVARLIYRYLLHGATGQSEEVDRLARLLAPPALRRTDRGDDEGGAPSPFEQTLSMCVEVGLLERRDGAVALSPALPEEARDPARGEAVLAKTIRLLVLAPHRN